jgi:5-bromo-4-chloroindolyl phosphate hydrolysis protein
VKNNRRRRGTGSIYTFAVTWALLSIIFPVFRVWGLALILALSSFAAYIAGLISGKKNSADDSSEESVKATAENEEVQKKAAPVKKSYGSEVDPIIEEGNKALSEMGRLYMSIKDTEVRSKINEIMRITDKIMQDAISDPSDIPQIKKFMSYYLPTTIKLLNAYDRMGAQGIEGENLDKSMKSINEMLDSAIEAYKKLLDSLFANQALDIETDIQVMNTMLAREGLSGEKDFNIK